MKLPRTPGQWLELTPDQKLTVEDASEIVISFMRDAGIESPQEPDSEGIEVSDQVQSLLMDAVLRSDKIRDHLLTVNQRQWQLRDQARPQKAPQQWGPWGSEGRQGN